MPQMLLISDAALPSASAAQTNVVSPELPPSGWTARMAVSPMRGRKALSPSGESAWRVAVVSRLAGGTDLADGELKPQPQRLDLVVESLLRADRRHAEAVEHTECINPGIDVDSPGGPTMDVIDPFSNTIRFCLTAL